MYFQTVLSGIAVIGSYWQLMLVISSYFDKKRDKKTKLIFLINFFNFFFRFNEHTNKSSKY